MLWTKSAAAVLLLGMTAIISPTAACQAQHIKDVEAVTEVFGDGENLASIIITYDSYIDENSVSNDDFFVSGREIARLYVKSPQSSVLTTDDFGSQVVIDLVPQPMSSEPITDPSKPKLNPMADGGGPTLGSHGNPKPIKIFDATVKQVGDITTFDGIIYPPTGEQKSSHTRQLIIEDFVQDIFYDPSQNNAPLMYNLYIPKDYDPQKSYPLVLFMHDAGTVSPEIKSTLVQGQGAISWASPEWQAEHPCFVLAPQYDTIIVNDKYQYGPELDRTIHLLNYLSEKYSIDQKRIYNTGQSMGGMTSIAMDVKYPDFFAASYLVGCKWDASVTAPLAKQNVWAVAAEGDPGARPSMDAIFSGFEAAGANVVRDSWDAELLSPSDVHERINAMIKDDVHLYYTLYLGGNHRYTWQYAYKMWPAMEWVFSNHKD